MLGSPFRRRFCEGGEGFLQLAMKMETEAQSRDSAHSWLRYSLLLAPT